ncbi:MAG TPA: toll/interleukin-1 receptor domain-containing protein [Thermoanaerobaculia bacterium]|nr:toll/interleukin-1 receptor domain-containing protein [Thermoanaerobaculia bacterium]
MTDFIHPPLRLTLLSSSDPTAVARARELERILDGTAAGIGWDLGTLESPPPGTEPLGEKLELKVFTARPDGEASAWLDATLHSVVVVLVDGALLADGPTLDWLRACAKHLDSRPGRHRLIAVPFDEGLHQRWLALGGDLGEYQTLLWTLLDPEPAGRADQLALRALQGMIGVLAIVVLGRPERSLRLFLSHAKLDGFYLAQSLRHFLDQQSWLSTFYDARDIEPGTSWKQALRDAVGRCLLLVLRTDLYDRRLWCRQEVRWAEAFGVPRVVVDARSGLVHPASELALESAPTVRIPDGNLARVLFAALQTALRSLLFQRRVMELQRLGRLPGPGSNLRVLSFPPSVETLARACQELGEPTEAAKRLIVYPDPPLTEGLGLAAEALVRSVGARLATPGQLASEAV